MDIFTHAEKVVICDLINTQDCGCISVTNVILDLHNIFDVVVMDIVNSGNGDCYRIFRKNDADHVFEVFGAMAGSEDEIRFIKVDK